MAGLVSVQPDGAGGCNISLVIPTVSETDPPPHVYVHSTDLCQCTKVPLKICSVDTGTPLTSHQLTS